MLEKESMEPQVIRKMEERSSFCCELFGKVHRFLSDLLRLSGG